MRHFDHHGDRLTSFAYTKPPETPIAASYGDFTRPMSVLLAQAADRGSTSPKRPTAAALDAEVAEMLPVVEVWAARYGVTVHREASQASALHDLLWIALFAYHGLDKDPKCEDCEGKGRITEAVRDYWEERECPSCNGIGTVAP